MITGASAGIGLHLARAFAAGGFDLVLVARRREKLAEVARRLQDTHGVEARAVFLDLTEPGAPEALYDEVEGAGGAPEALVNNAGMGTYGPFVDTPLEDTRRVMRLNMESLTALTRLFLPAMVVRGRGRILNVVSTAAFQPGPLMAVYYASKAYVLHLSEALADELRKTGVTVTALCPGPTPTEFQARADMERSGLLREWWMMDPEAVALAGYRGAMAGRRVVVPGLLNKMTAFVPRLLPRPLMARMVRAVQAPK